MDRSSWMLTLRSASRLSPSGTSCVALVAVRWVMGAGGVSTKLVRIHPHDCNLSFDPRQASSVSHNALCLALYALGVSLSVSSDSTAFGGSLLAHTTFQQSSRDTTCGTHALGQSLSGDTALQNSEAPGTTSCETIESVIPLSGSAALQHSSAEGSACFTSQHAIASSLCCGVVLQHSSMVNTTGFTMCASATSLRSGAEPQHSSIVRATCCTANTSDAPVGSVAPSAQWSTACLFCCTAHDSASSLCDSPVFQHSSMAVLVSKGREPLLVFPLAYGATLV
mmetsp:Transcript_4092/g.11507  ORF Transcript_4092/g.11507 Transcript_4092/m.11507 type:complete len:281 (+) Transcript_4092:1962-2804(+)